MWESRDFQYTDYRLEVDVRAVGRVDSGGGLLFGENDAGHYELMVSDGSFTLARLDYGSDTWTTLIKWNQSPAVRPGNQTNRLKVIRSGNSISLFVNDQAVGAVTDGSYQGSRVGTVASAWQPNSEVRFDNFVLDGVSCTPGQNGAGALTRAANGANPSTGILASQLELRSPLAGAVKQPPVTGFNRR